MTRTTPAAAVTTIVSTVMLSGGALRPVARRRRTPVIDTTANRITSTMSMIHPARTLMLSFTRS